MLHVRFVKKGRNQSVLFTGPKILVLAANLQGCPASRITRPAKVKPPPDAVHPKFQCLLK